MIDSARIRDFWTWFAGACGTFGERFENAAAIEELGARIAGLGEFSWELGPGRKNPYNTQLVISPGGDRDLLPLAREIVAQAPPLPGWEYAPARPPKEWDLRASLEYDGVGTIFLDARGWRYALLKHPDGMFEIEICAPELAYYDEDVKQVAAGIILDGELGEDARLDHIAVIKVVAEFDGRLADSANPLGVLKDQWTELTGS
jgi:hypothetical protein